MQLVKGGVTSPKGFRAAGFQCGVKNGSKKRDVAVILSEELCTAAAVYTRNLVKAAPLHLTRRHLRSGTAQAVIANSGNANACNADGMETAARMAKVVADELFIPEEEVIVASTGVIGQPLPVERIENGLQEMEKRLSSAGGTDAAEAIMTTDTFKKEAAVQFDLGETSCTIGAMAKGSGMIAPNMGTMLCFVTTDAGIESSALQAAVRQVADRTFNRVVVDGDTSTNDMLCVLANGLAGNDILQESDLLYPEFVAALELLCRHLAREMARDGEGAKRLLECTVENAATEEDAGKVARSIIGSSLVKAAFFGGDANWGRILCAAGYAGVPLSPDGVDVELLSDAGRIQVCQGGSGTGFDEKRAAEILAEREIKILVRLSEGEASATAWGCDLTYDYVRINGDYRS